MKTYCKKCGKCCSLEIPVTLLDISKIAVAEKINENAVFKNFIQDTLSEKSGLFKIRKKADLSCIFLDAHKECTIHNSKPEICRLYDCKAASDASVPWTSRYTASKDQALLWKQSVAIEITRKYISVNGISYNEKDYRNALRVIDQHTIDKESQKIKLAKDNNGQAICMIYDCSACPARGSFASETIITLPDIQRITDHLKIDWQTFFNDKIDKALNDSGLLKIKRNKHCVFFHPDKHCTIDSVRPFHCRFTPCPKKVTNSNDFDCFYLGNGSIEDQFHHHSAINFTKEYTALYGAVYNSKGVENILHKYEVFLKSGQMLEQFCRSISSYRFVDDTLPYLINR